MSILEVCILVYLAALATLSTTANFISLFVFRFIPLCLGLAMVLTGLELLP